MQIDPAQQCVPFEGARLAYDITGAGEPLVLIHGSSLDRRMWDGQVAALAARYRVMRYDARGHGASVCAAVPYAHERDLHALLLALGIERATLIGASMGGRIALQFALAYPELVAALVIATAGMDDYTYGAEVHACRAAMVAALERGASEDAITEFLRTWVVGPRRTFEQVSPELLERVREMARKAQAHTALDGCEEVFAPSMRSRLQTIAVPTLVMAGEHDLPDMLEIAALIAEHVPGAERVIVPGVGHLVNLEMPEMFNATVLDFLARHLDGDRAELSTEGAVTT